MTTKFCDHGAYGSATFSGYISNTANSDNGVAGDVLTVTSVASGIVNIGSHVTGAGTLAGTIVTGFTSGTQGGAGVYTIGVHPLGVTQIVRATTSFIGSFAGPLTVPLTWGLAQDGDGGGKTAATSATASIDLSAATAAAGAVFSIMGCTLTCVASGATTNQFNAGAGATLVSNLVTAINRTTNTTTVVAQATGWRASKIQDVVFARVGAPSTTLDIMTRSGSTQYNTRIVTTSGFTGGTFGPYTFSGGGSGCWGWAIRSSRPWPCRGRRSRCC